MLWKLLLAFFLVSALGCSIGFKKFVYFLSLGYGFSVALLGLAYLVAILVNGFSWNVLTILLCLLLITYGARLSWFLWYRERKKESYKKSLNTVAGSYESSLNVFALLAIWIFVAVLYVAQSLPVFFRAYNGLGHAVVLPLVGFLLGLAGLALESVADVQKSAQKETNPDMVAMEGLFRWCRCPNYFGEILFWTGIFVSGLGGLCGVGQWVTAVLGYLCIVVVMVSSARRLEVRQEAAHKNDLTYRTYADHTPILFPLVPLYHLTKTGDQSSNTDKSA